MRRPTSVTELQRAWVAVQEGRFRGTAGDLPRALPRRSNDGPEQDEPVWDPGVPVLPIVGCHGSAGASTIAAAIATSLDGAARLVEAGPAGSSGLAGYATAELGATGSGWLRGRRERVVIDRVEAGCVTPTDVPLPEAAEDVTACVLDAGWDLAQLVPSPGWVRAAVLQTGRMVLVTTATVPGMRRLESALFHLHQAGQQQAVVAVRGPRANRWPREVQHCLSPSVRAEVAGALVEIPEDPGLRVRGLDTTALPRGVLDAASQIVQLTELAARTDTTNSKGNTHAH